MSSTIDADVESNPVGTNDTTSQYPTSMTSVPANDTIDAGVCSDVNQLWAVAVPEEDEEMFYQGVEVPNHSIIPIPYDLKKHNAEDTESGTNDSCEVIEELQAIEKKVAKEDSTTRPATVLEWTKTIYSGILLLVCIYVASAAFFKKQTAATGRKNLPPVVAFFMFFGLLLWLALMEGGLNCMVGLQAIDKEKYRDSHKYTYLCQKWVSTSHKLEKFIVGRQFLDLSIVFVSNFLVSTIDDADIGLPSWVTKVFLDSGLAVIVITIVIGQLVSQITAAHCMLDWINNRVFVFTACVAMTVEATGLLHSVYFIQHSVAWCTGSELEAKWDSQASFVWYWLRVTFSTLILCLAWAVTLHALWNGDTTMWDGVHPVVSIVMLVVLILGTGILEALQIAMITVVHWAPEKLAAHPAASRTCKFAMHGNNLQAFLIGRQILQTIIMFLIARVMTLRDGATTLLGDNAVLQSILSTGLLGALISTVVASLSWRILAWSFPVAFLTVGFVPVKVCLWIEKTGICSVAWLIADIHRHIMGFKYDEVYLGEMHTADDVKEMHNMPLH